MVRAGPDVILAFDEHGGIHEELGDVCESIAKAFGEKDLEELVLEGLIDLFVHGLSLFWLSTFRLKALNRRCKSPQGSGTPCVIPIPLHRDHAR